MFTVHTQRRYIYISYNILFLLSDVPPEDRTPVFVGDVILLMVRLVLGSVEQYESLTSGR